MAQENPKLYDNVPAELPERKVIVRYEDADHRQDEHVERKEMNLYYTRKGFVIEQRYHFVSEVPSQGTLEVSLESSPIKGVEEALVAFKNVALNLSFDVPNVFQFLKEVSYTMYALDQKSMEGVLSNA